jgi:hypothetical protein
LARGRWTGGYIVSLEQLLSRTRALAISLTSLPLYSALLMHDADDDGSDYNG